METDCEALTFPDVRFNYKVTAFFRINVISNLVGFSCQPSLIKKGSRDNGVVEDALADKCTSLSNKLMESSKLLFSLARDA